MRKLYEERKGRGKKEKKKEAYCSHNYFNYSTQNIFEFDCMLVFLLFDCLFILNLI